MLPLCSEVGAAFKHPAPHPPGPHPSGQDKGEPSCVRRDLCCLLGAGRSGATGLSELGQDPTHNLVPVGDGEEGGLVLTPEEPVGAESELRCLCLSQASESDHRHRAAWAAPVWAFSFPEGTAGHHRNPPRVGESGLHLGRRAHGHLHPLKLQTRDHRPLGGVWW